MGYCLNPTCSHPDNPTNAERCQSCGSQLLLQGRYRVVKSLGQGGFGATFLAHDEMLPGKPSCVIKQLRPSASAPHVLQMARELFEREAETLGRIGTHPQLPRLLAYFEDHQQFYLVQEYISGLTLQQEVRRSGPFSEAGVKQFLSEILPMLQYIHAQQVIHRDIKPANLIRRLEDCKLVLIDFGAVKNQVDQLAMSESSEQTALTAYAIGTPGFAPPEQMSMRPVYASDIYAVGVTCIYLLTGKSPKDLDHNPSTCELLWQHLVQVSDHIADVLKKMLEVSVRHRYQSADEVLRALDLEPYLDSLAKGMASQRNPAKPERPVIRIGPDSGGPPSSPSVSHQAAAIRARRARLAEATGLQSGVARYQALTAKPTTTALKSEGSTGKSKPRKIDAHTLLMAYVKGRRDFAQHDLSLLDLQQAELSGVNFHNSKLDRTNLQRANLCNSDFGKASLSQANLREANLSRAYLNHADLQGADLRNADLSQAYLKNANLRGANLCGANLTGANVGEDQLSQAKTNWSTVRPSGKWGLL